MSFHFLPGNSQLSLTGLHWKDSSNKLPQLHPDPRVPCLLPHLLNSLPVPCLPPNSDHLVLSQVIEKVRIRSWQSTLGT